MKHNVSAQTTPPSHKKTVKHIEDQKASYSDLSKGDFKITEQKSKTSKKSCLKSTLSPECNTRLQEQQSLLYMVNVIGKPLFKTVVGDQNVSAPSLLVSGFGLRNLSSLQKILKSDEKNKLDELFVAQEKQDFASVSADDSIPETSAASSSKTESSSTQTEESVNESSPSIKDKLMYLMGLQDEEEEEEYVSYQVKEKLPLEISDTVSESMRQAQHYLRVHNIFKFFQFIIAHLLSALPDNPIEFIIVLLNRCLVFRSGLCDPPLLYTKKHLECLFYLMDKMRTGYIDMKQYVTGMNTVSVSSFNETPPTTSDGLVNKEFFITEAYDRLTDQLEDLIRRKWLRVIPPRTPSFTTTGDLCSVTSDSDEDFSVEFTKTKMFIK